MYLSFSFLSLMKYQSINQSEIGNRDKKFGAECQLDLLLLKFIGKMAQITLISKALDIL